MNIQSFLAIGGMFILSLTSLRFNKAILTTSTVEIENKISLTAISLANDLIEEIKVKSFDKSTTEFPTTNVLSLTSSANLGPDAGETYPNYNDIDDYNNFVRNIDAPHTEGYSVMCVIQYVEENNPNNVSSSQTFYKKATVTVTNIYLSYPITLSFIFTLK